MNLSKKYIYLILTGICFLVYANSLNGAFVSDDITSILKNPYISNPLHYWSEPAMLLNSLNYLLARFNPFVYHLTSIILHSINTILVFFFLQLFFETKASFLAAILFAVHPIHTEAVSWISGRQYLIQSLFILTVYLLYYRSTYSANNVKGLNFSLYLFCLIIFSYFIIEYFTFFALAPFLLLLSDFTFNRWRKNWKLWLPFLAIAVTRVILAIQLIPGRVLSMEKEMGVKVVWNNPLFNMAYSLFRNFGLMLWPVKLTLYHEPTVVSYSRLKVELIILASIICALPFIFKKAKEIFFGLGIFILFLAPTYSPAPIASPIAERYLYFPSIALSIFAAFFYQKYKVDFPKPIVSQISTDEKQQMFTDISNGNLCQSVSSHPCPSVQKRTFSLTNIGPVYTIIFIFIIVISAIRTWVRNKDWRTPNAFWKAAVAVSPNSERAHNNLGETYYREGNTEGAIREFKKAIELNPNLTKGYNNLAIIYEESGKREEALELFKKAIELNPNYATAHYNLGNLYSNLGKTEEAISYFKKAIEFDPNYADPYHNLAVVQGRAGKREEALELFKKAIELNPNYTTAYHNLANLYISIARPDEAIEVYKKLLKVNPSYIPAYNNLGIIYKRKGQFKEAIEVHKKALSIDERIVPVHINLGNLYKTMGMDNEAKLEFEKALQIDPNLSAAKEGLLKMESENATDDRR